MEIFDSITEALREVKNQAENLDIHECIILVADYYGEEFYVSNEALDISEKLVRDFFENGCEPSPENLADDCNAFEYALAKNKEIYPNLYKTAKKPSFSSDAELIRKRIQITPEYSLSFNIG